MDDAVEDLVFLVTTCTGHPVSSDDALRVIAAWVKSVTSYDEDPTGQLSDGIWRTARYLGLPVA